MPVINKLNILTKSIWVFHFASAACNNCDIEILDVLTPRFDAERFGIKLIGSIKHADAMLVSGIVTRKSAPMLKDIYAMAPQPLAVIAFGSCASSQGMFKDSCMRTVPVDEIIPVNAYIPGCPPRPEAIIDGIVKVIKKLRGEI
ncbi:MAG: NADH-quinone oxidoreductase subunit NuoB [Candidatus Omnitrophota bacterium]|nr:NADH-quinone oxidoreductase subunit NuoB [Candidatus Omnitrophota bacterium]MBU2527828.1 NADH-quinone oxidoreductase subunit NuoB [bacterium]MBU3930743.1 NADH-quinone oxidoreductase subunit NuoB [bacterium]MBU4122899.1 NADH-quinone oxidoreductase subunit NuoB [bacterium]